MTKRFCLLVATSATVAALITVVVAVAAPTAGAKAPPRESLGAVRCGRALDPPNRSVSVRATMRHVTGTRSLSMKFDLLKRSGGVTHSVVGGDLGVWLTPQDRTLGRRGGDVWQLNKSVSNLEAPASYRFRVTFRWVGTHSKVLSTVVRRSGRCTQRELRPDLLVRSVAVTAIAHHPHRQRYTVVVANRGVTGAGAFEVLFTPGDNTRPQSDAVTRLAAKASKKVSFVGPVCSPGSPPTVVADSLGQVDDYNRDNNAMTVACPH